MKDIFASRDLNKLSEKVNAPTLICTGKSDYLATSEHTKKLLESIEQPSLIEVSETHFTTLFSKEVEDAVINHIKYAAG